MIIAILPLPRHTLGENRSPVNAAPVSLGRKPRQPLRRVARALLLTALLSPAACATQPAPAGAPGSISVHLDGQTGVLFSTHGR